jgi:serine/threonine-protein kinase
MTVNKKDFGAFELHERIGSGGMASVFLGVQKSLDRKVVLKILYPHLAEDAQLVERFEREARAAALLKHENIVQVIDCGRLDDVPYIAMEFVEGMDLDKWVATWGTPPLEVGLLMLREIFSGLEHAHRHRIVHRDIKPANVMFTRDGALKIMDFGLARRESDSKGLTVVGSVLGTPAYMSPEQATGGEVDERGDIFSAGVLSYQLLSGVRPFEGASYSVILNSILTAEPKRVSEVNPLIPVSVAAMIQKMIQKDPGQRFQTSAELRAELENQIEAMGLLRHRELLRMFAADPKTFGDALRDKRLTRHFEEGVRLEGEGPGMTEAAQLEFRRVLYLDPNHRAALDHLKKLDREASRIRPPAPAPPAAEVEAAPAPVAAPPRAAPPAAKPPARPAAPQAAKPAPKPAKPVKPAGAKASLPLPLILLGVIGLLVVLLVVRLLMPKKEPTPASPPVAANTIVPPSPPPAMTPATTSAQAPPTASSPTGTQNTPPQTAVTPPIEATTRPVEPSVPPPAPAVIKPAVATPVPVTPASNPAATATIKVSTEPPGASVSIDNVRQAQRTNASYRVTPGTHTLVIEKTGYYSQDMPVSDIKSGETRPAGVSLKPVPAAGAVGTAAEGTLEIHVVPSSRIFVNDAMVRSDATQATLRLPAGAYTVRAENKTYGSQVWHRDVKADAPVKIDYDFQVASYGKLRVTSSGHNGARVLVDGQDIGLTTPCTIEKLAAGPHTVSVTLEGFEGPPQNPTIKAGAVTDLNFKLSKAKKHH